MKYLFFLIVSYNFIFANIFESLKDFAYDKKVNQNISIKKAEILSFYDNKNPCIELLITDNEVSILKTFDSCKKLNNATFLEFLNKDFLSLYQDKQLTLKKELKNLKNAMQDIMIYYKLHCSFSKDIKDMSKNQNLTILNIDEKEGGVLLYKINNQACIGIELQKINNRMAMKVYGIENLDRQCKILIDSPSFKNLSYSKKDFNLYYLE